MFEKLGLPSIFADESLYSWTARYHKLSCSYCPNSSSQRLYGAPYAGLHHDFPTQLKAFDTNTQSTLGSPDLLLRNHTVLGFYDKFIPHNLKSTVYDAFLVGKCNVSKALLGLKKYPTGMLHSLKICPICLSEQLAAQHLNYWITSQQLPSSFTCQVHHVPLVIYKLPYYRGHAANFYLPNSHLENSHYHYLQQHPLISTHLKSISEWGYWIYDSDYIFTDEILRWCYLFKASLVDLVSFDGNVRTKKLRDDFVQYYGKEIAYFFGPELFGGVFEGNYGFIAALLRNTLGRKHPLKHIIMLNYLFEDVDDFETIYKNVIQDFNQGGEVLLKSKLTLRQKSLIDAVKQGSSLNSIAENLGTSVNSAARFLDKQQITRHRFTRVVGSEKEKQLVALLKSGTPRKEICEKLFLKPSFIKYYLGLNKSLNDEWHLENNKQKIVSYRNHLKSITTLNPTISIKALKRIPGNGFHWLQQYDTDWLKDNLPSLWNN